MYMLSRHVSPSESSKNTATERYMFFSFGPPKYTETVLKFAELMPRARRENCRSDREAADNGAYHHRRRFMMQMSCSSLLLSSRRSIKDAASVSSSFFLHTLKNSINKTAAASVDVSSPQRE
jgi:hypothetical protein